MNGNNRIICNMPISANTGYFTDDVYVEDVEYQNPTYEDKTYHFLYLTGRALREGLPVNATLWLDKVEWRLVAGTVIPEHLRNLPPAPTMPEPLAELAALRAENARLKAVVTELRDALEPFAVAADGLKDEHGRTPLAYYESDGMPYQRWLDDDGDTYLSVQHLLDAAKALGITYNPESES